MKTFEQFLDWLTERLLGTKPRDVDVARVPVEDPRVSRARQQSRPGDAESI